MWSTAVGRVESLACRLRIALNIDGTNINTNLVGQTELRSIAGCNGNGDAYQTVCYALAGGWRNEKGWEASHP